MTFPDLPIKHYDFITQENLDEKLAKVYELIQLIQGPIPPTADIQPLYSEENFKNVFAVATDQWLSEVAKAEGKGLPIYRQLRIKQLRYQVFYITIYDQDADSLTIVAGLPNDITQDVIGTIEYAAGHINGICFPGKVPDPIQKYIIELTNQQIRFPLEPKEEKVLSFHPKPRPVLKARGYFFDQASPKDFSQTTASSAAGISIVSSDSVFTPEEDSMAGQTSYISSPNLHHIPESSSMAIAAAFQDLHKTASEFGPRLPIPTFLKDVPEIPLSSIALSFEALSSLISTLEKVKEVPITDPSVDSVLSPLSSFHQYLNAEDSIFAKHGTTYGPEPFTVFYTKDIFTTTVIEIVFKFVAQFDVRFTIEL